MLPTSNKFIPTEEIERLTAGSYEHLIKKLDEAVEHDRQRIFGKDVGGKVLATFPTVAVVLSEDGDVCRIKFETANSGAIQIVGSESVTAAVYEEKDLSIFVKREAARVVDSFLQGTLSDAWKRLEALVPYVDAKPHITEERVTEVFLEFVKTPRPWKQLFEERKAFIKRSIWDRLPKVEETRLFPKFTKLRDGSIPADALEGYRGLVVEDLASISTRLKALLESVSKSFSAIEKAKEKLTEDTGNEVLTTFGDFSEDLGYDLSSLRDLLETHLAEIRSVPNLARLYDTLAEELYRFEVAGCFVAATASRLTEANP